MLEELGVIFKVRLVAPMPTKKFDSGVGKWAARLRASGPNKIRLGADKPIEKIKDMIKEKARSESITEDEVLKKYPALFKMLKGYQLSKEKTEKALLIENRAGFSRFDAGVDRGQVKYDRMSRECSYPLYGSKKYGVKGLIFLGMMALCGDRQLRKCLKPRLDKIITGKPLAICPPENLKDFRKQLRGQIAESGTVIIKVGSFSLDMLKNHSGKLNRLANRYRRPEIAPFTSGGASHIDFIVEEIPDSTKPGMRIKQLGLDIQVAGV